MAAEQASLIGLFAASRAASQPRHKLGPSRRPQVASAKVVYEPVPTSGGARQRPSGLAQLATGRGAEHGCELVGLELGHVVVEVRVQHGLALESASDAVE